ncbi:lipopolysaccharide biosynthesis protein [Ruminococcus sp. OA3]|uniref:lipopolysaccharide biosynthesis protein n=1 Tax=Ruminococcus sp. OA3 TaxID=2914164 RepID=UPI001F06E9FE|nr:lipopolysaccharide biosynthesis protein [Ruminococcus sp. OA3]MCH1982949.1 lipopolysaccharide biosynthesis protein [Ruminococcus sp. OA3]
MTKDNTIQKSMGWSLSSEVAVKFVVPVTNMILARVLTPDAFGVVAVCNMLVSFVDLITDAGFGKYLVQHDFESEEEKGQYADVSFWTNLGISVLMTVLIILFRFPIASFLGHRDYGNVIAIASVQLIITSVSSIQTAIFRREFEFKKLFVARISVAAAPLMITVPLALILRSFWALIIGNISGALVNAMVLTAFSKWRPGFFYKVTILKRMFNYSFWSLCEALANWTIFWVDTFIVGSVFSEYQLGLYKNSTNMVQSIMGMISASMSPVLLSTLSRLKNSKEKYSDAFLNIYNLILYLILPMGAGLFLYRDTATLLLFGSQWSEAANIVGAWGLMMLCSVTFYSFPAELYKSKGIPQVLFLFQMLYLVILIPVCIVSAGYGFWIMVYARCLCVLWQVFISVIFMKKYIGMALNKFFVTFITPCLATGCMVIGSVFMKTFLRGTPGDIIAIFICTIIYTAFLAIFARRQITRSISGMRDNNLK